MASCSAFQAASVLGKRWTLPLLQQIALHKDSGFNALQHRMRTVSPKVLAQRLHELEKLGVVAKRASGIARKRTAYVLTPKGVEFAALATALRAWSGKHTSDPGCATRECTSCPKY